MKNSLAHISMATFTCSAFCLALSVSQIAHSQTPLSQQISQTQHANVQDIVFQASGHDLHILIKLDVQPMIASAALTPDGIVVSIKDIHLKNKDIDPPTKPYLTRAQIKSGQSSQIIFSTISLSSVETKIYRDAILVSARTIDALPVLAPRAPPSIPQQPADVPKPAPNLSPSTSLAQHFQLDRSACDQAQQILLDDPWNLDIMADHALCLVSDNKLDAAENTIAQLESFMPNNWKSVLARGEIYRRNGDDSQAHIKYAYALQYVENKEDKQNLEAWISQNS